MHRGGRATTVTMVLVSYLPKTNEIVLVRHGATEWSANGRHTSRTDLPLTEEGLQEAAHLRSRLADREFALVLTSPMQRARHTAELCGLASESEIDENLCEWDYGDYEGVTTKEIRETHPQWTVWSGPIPNGETPEQVAARADAVLERAASATGDVALFSHGHFLRVLVARWLGLEAVDGRLFAMRTATLSALGYEREQRVLNDLNG
jgi:broad specificity phosphatase PhoE